MDYSVTEFKALINKKKNKFNANRVEYNGVFFDSSIEAEFAKYLDLLKKTGEIKGYKHHVLYEIIINDILVCKYELDFLVEISENETKHYDVKGFCKNTAYSLFRLKKKLMKAVNNIDVIEAVYDRKEKTFKYKL